MKLHFDLDLGYFVSAPGTTDPLTSISCKRGDTFPLEVRFYSAGVVTELAGGATGIFGLKESGKYDADYVASDSAWIKAGTGTSTTYTFALDTNTAEIADLLNHGDGNSSNDVATLALMAEMEFTVSGAVRSSQTLVFNLQNDVNKGTEGTPITQPSAAEWLLGSTAPRNDATVDVTGTLTDGTAPVVFPPLIYAGTQNGKPIYTEDGDIPETPVAAGYHYVYWSALPAEWVLTKQGSARWWSASDTATPNLATGWAATSPATGTPTVSIVPTATPPYIRVHGGFLYIQEAGTWKKTALSAL